MVVFGTWASNMCCDGVPWLLQSRTGVYIPWAMLPVVIRAVEELHGQHRVRGSGEDWRRKVPGGWILSGGLGGH